ncbi:MAG: hypothetical protein JNN30_05370 [Rhodanobacteraceae bacterium]|nr:hypothetical protein [Rhodanobacteraceae bacterium]
MNTTTSIPNGTGSSGCSAAAATAAGQTLASLSGSGGRWRSGWLGRFAIGLALVLTTVTAVDAANGDAPDPVFASSFEPLFPGLIDLTSRTPTPGARLSSEIGYRVGARFARRSEVPAALLRVYLDGKDISAACAFDAAEIDCGDLAAQPPGTHTVTVRAGDSRFSWSYQTLPAPRVVSLTPHGTLPHGSRPQITGTFSDPSAVLSRDGVQLWLDEVDVTASAEIVLDGSHAGSVRYTPSQPLATGVHRSRLFVTNDAGIRGGDVAHIDIAPAADAVVRFLQPAGGQSVVEPEFTVRVSAVSNISDVESVLINGEAAEAVSFAQPASEYRRTLTLHPGDNPVVAIARFADGSQAQASTNLTFDTPPNVTIISPVDWQTLGPESGSGPRPGGSINLTGSVERPVAIVGRASKRVVGVQINQQQAVLDADGQGFRFERYLLHEGTNLISVNATDSSGRVGSAQITVYLDQTAPLLTVESPREDALTSAASIDVRGVANDAVEGGIHAPEPSVVVRNAANGQTVEASVTDRYFLARDLPLEVGANALVVTATDALGNARSREWRATRVAAGSERITLLGGDRQSGDVNSVLPQPLAVTALDSQGLPLVSKPIHFDVLRGAGSIRRTAAQAEKPDGVNPARNLVVTTDAAGRAEVWLALGNEAALAGNAVRAWSPDVAEEVMFTATGRRLPPAHVVVSGAAGTQYVQTQSQPLEGLTAVVLDAERNPLAGTPVHFVIDAGADAEFRPQSAASGNLSADGKTLVVLTDKNGLASVRPFTGIRAGTVRVRAFVQMDAATVVGTAVFQLLVLPRRDGPTGFSGVVLDHSGKPLQGVRLSITRTPLSTVSDSNGRFQFDDQVPPGKIDLDVDGRALQSVQNGQAVEYPRLHFETAVIQGQMNQLPHPIYLPPINRSQARVVGGDEDVSLTIPGLEGFEMVVKANSVTFPDGSRVGPVVVTPVHVDRLPMVPPGPSSVFSAVAWTIQPTNTRFDPPIAVKIPNVEGLKPGETKPIVQWDHDLAAFIPMGRGTVSEDGTQIVTDAGSGITKAGWGSAPAIPPPETCGTNPPPATCKGSNCSPCPDCEAPAGQPCPSCAPDSGQNGRRCRDSACRACVAGACQLKPGFREDKPQGKEKLEFSAGYARAQILSKAEFRAYREGYYAALPAPEVFADWQFELAPYCTPEGQWRFVLAESKITSKIIERWPSPFTWLNAPAIHRIDDEVPPGGPYCERFKSVDLQLKLIASSAYGRPRDNPVVAALLDAGWQRLSAGLAGQPDYAHAVGTDAHERLHYWRFRQEAKRQWPTFRRQIEGLETPVQPGDSPSAAAARVKQQSDDILRDFERAVASFLTSPHSQPEEFYECAMGGMGLEWIVLSQLRHQRQCPEVQPVVPACPKAIGDD